MKKTGFTLAEVLITLGVIGIVAAMTIPNLVQSYKKKVVETRLVNFYSTINQALRLSEVDNGNSSTWGTFLGNTFDEKKEWFEKYLCPYLKDCEIKRLNRSELTLYMYDGGCIYLSSTLSDLQYFPFCNLESNIKGKDAFYFFYSPNRSAYSEKNVLYINKNTIVEPYKYGWDGSIEKAKEDCKSRGAFCTLWIQSNGWKIPEDYPFKF